MRLLRLGICVVVAAAAWSVLATAASAAVPAAPPRTQLVRFSCQQALDPDNRSIGVRAIMRPLTGTRRLAIRFDLLQRVGSAAPTALRAGDLGVWVTPSSPTLGQVPGDVWRLDKSVIDLAAPATYQFRVSFRWIGVNGHVLGSAVRYSRKCRQPELRPDLAVTSLTVTPVTGHPDQNLYTAVIANRGATGAGPFEVLFVPGGGAAATTDNITFLGAGRSRTLSFTGPVCNAADRPSVTADAAQQVDDYNRANNTATAVCPASGG
jgi:CARDB